MDLPATVGEDGSWTPTTAGPVPPTKIKVPPQSSGSLWPLRQHVGAGGEFHIGEWTVTAFAGHPILQVLAPKAHLPWLDHASMAEKALDLMSVAAGQHYERDSLNPRNQRIRWDWQSGEYFVEFQTQWHQELPFTMYEGPADQQTTNEEARRPTYSKAMRYFRCAQTATNIATAYQQLFLCLEALLSAKVPKIDDEREKKWLFRAGREVLPTYQQRAREEVDKAGGLEVDLGAIYDLRLSLFHGKLGQDPLMPLDQARFAATRGTYWRLVDHVRELLRPFQIWPGVSRLGTSEEIGPASEPERITLPT